MVKKQALLDNSVPDEEIVAEIDPAQYNSIARCAQILSVQMIESNFVITPQFFDSSHAGKHDLDFADTHGSFDKESRVVTCMFQFESYIRKFRKKVFNCRSKFVVFYGIPVDCDDAHALAFARKTGLLACYPYFRTYVATVASLANAEVPILPTLSAMPVKQKIREKP